MSAALADFIAASTNRYVGVRPPAPALAQIEETAIAWLARIMGVIPIASTDGPKALAQSLRAARDALRNGDLVCVFAEGQISRIGTMLKFKRGFERVVQGVDAPIIPTFLDCVWGSIFSFQGGRFFWKWPKQFPMIQQ